jgi:hypothetical protein
MPADSRTCFRIQFSLRTFLIVSCVLGVAAGVLGRLFFRNPEVFLIVVYLLSTVVPFLVAIGTILWIGFRSKPWSTPICGQCKRDVPSTRTDRVKNCPECGEDLTGPKAVLFMRGQGRHWGLIAWGGMLLLMPILGSGVFFFASRVVGPSPGNLRFQSTQQLLQQRLPNQIDQPWIWNELENRLKAGSLSQQEVDDAIGQLISYMTTTRPKGWNQPLSWQRNFLKSATQAGMIPEPVLLELCDAFYGLKPIIQPLARLREGKNGLGVEIEYGNVWGDNSSLGLELLWQVNRVLLDGKPINVRQDSKLGQRWSGYHEGGLKSGNYEVTVEIECAYVDQDKLIGLNTGDLPKNRWPKARKQWKQSVSAPLHVYAIDKAIVALVTEPSRAPRPAGGILVDRLVAQADRDGKKKIVLKCEFPKGLSIPLSYDVAASINGQLIGLGPVWIVQDGNTHAQGGSQLEGRVDVLDPSIKNADVILTPNPSHIEHRPEVSEIWGKKSILRDVPIERLDLEARQGTEGP